MKKRRLHLIRSIGENLELFSNNSKLSIKSKPGIRFSTYKKELIEKRKIKIKYNINDRTLNRLLAIYDKNLSLDYFIMMLETRLDNVIYRSGFSKTRNQARQFIVHGLVKVNNIKVDKPSFIVNTNDFIFINVRNSIIINNSYFLIIGSIIKVTNILFYKNFKSSFNFFYLTKLLNK
ncbi:S4 domain-containing protein [Candidatus Vidania fulgoroideorum]